MTKGDGYSKMLCHESLSLAILHLSSSALTIIMKSFHIASLFLYERTGVRSFWVIHFGRMQEWHKILLCCNPNLERTAIPWGFNHKTPAVLHSIIMAQNCYALRNDAFLVLCGTSLELVMLLTHFNGSHHEVHL